MAHKPTEAVRRPPAMAPVDGRSRILAVALEAFSGEATPRSACRKSPTRRA
jgi:hypothetical protein